MRRRFARNSTAVLALIALAALIVFALLGPALWKPGEVPALQAPSWGHPFGTTAAGQDLLALVTRGLRRSLAVGLVAGLLATALSTVWGATAGYCGGWIDELLMRIVDVVVVIPLIVLVIVVTGSGGASWLQVALAIGCLEWVAGARIIRGVVLSLREREFVVAAELLGVHRETVIARHLLPNAGSQIAVIASTSVIVAILTEAALSFVGLGTGARGASLGLLVRQGQAAIAAHPWLFYIPGAFLILLCVAVALVGDGVRDAIDPRC